MSAPFTQDARMGKLTTVLGPDTLVLLRFDGADYVNDLFEYRVEALSAEPNLDFDGLIGTHASVEIESQNDGIRAYDGIVTEAKWAGVGENGNRYALTLRPWFWLAGRRRNQRIFHDMTVVQIIEELLAPYGGLGDPALEVKLTATYPALEYTVQYRESDLAFATRLMERFGISYHFAHQVGSHTLVLTDTIDNHSVIPGGERAYKPVDSASQSGDERFWEWHPERRLTTGAVRLTDYNFKTPQAAMEVERVGDAAYAEGQIESYDYPGDYLDQEQGKDVVGLRILQERGQDIRHRAVGDCTSLGAGMTLTLTGDQVNGVRGADYLCLMARHSYVSDAYGSGGTDSAGEAYSGEYVLIPTTVPLAPERKTPMPAVQGPQTAVVVGEGEIDCDEYGRILVHFHWDLNKAYSMRCRVSQNWASKGWGGMVIPRIGMEVVVEFLEGDPDKPLVTGCVYNGKNTAPYALPKHKTRSTFRTDTHLGEGYNELRFEDEKGREEIHLHAQLDHSVKVLNHQTNRVDRTKVESIGAASLREVKFVDVHNIGMDMTVNVGTGPHGGFVRKPLTDNPQGIRVAAYNFEQSFPELSGKGNYTLTAASGIALSAGTTLHTNIGGEATLTYGASLAQSVQANMRETTGKNHSQVVGAKYRLDAHEEIHLRCGAAELIMRPDGTVIINGKDMTTTMSGNIEGTVGGNMEHSVGGNVDVNAGGNLNESAGGSMKLSASKIDLN